MASQSGRFMSDDGRTVFATSDALVEGDTDGLVDVYEFVGGRPQLISSGTAQADLLPGNRFFPGRVHRPRGDQPRRASTSTSRPTTRWPRDEDHNGQFVKFYDARTNGGFTPPQAHLPCVAADECHGDENPGPEPRRSRPPPTSARREQQAERPRSAKKHHKRRAKAHHRRHHRKRDRERTAWLSATDQSGRLVTLAGRDRSPCSSAWCFADRARTRPRKSPSSTPTSPAPRPAAIPTSITRSTWTTRQGSSNRALQLRGRPDPRHALPDRLHRQPAQRAGLQR